MPIYTYKCNKCGHEFDVMQKVGDEPVKKCELCQEEVRRVFHPVGIIFKGSGFYSTDNKNKDLKDSSTKEKPSNEKSEKPEEKKKVEKPEASEKKVKSTDTKDSG